MPPAVFRGPGRYVQGEDVLAEADEHFGAIGGRGAFVAGGETALEAVGEKLAAALEAAGIEEKRESGVASCTDERVGSLADRAEAAGADLIVGVGGGTALDATKAAATRTDLPFASVPTVPSTDAPASAVAVLYDEAGRTAGVELRDRSPELVLADTSVLAAAPPDFLRYGLGDAIATRFEAEAVVESGGTTLRGTAPTDSGLALARRCHGSLVECGVDALSVAGSGDPTRAFERAVEAVFLQSALGFENGGLAGAHAMEFGFRTAGITDPPHGLVVGFCALAQLELEDAPASASVANLLSDLGLDVTLEELGVDDDTIEEIAAMACGDRTPMDNEPVAATLSGVAAALRAADAKLAD